MDDGIHHNGAHHYAVAIGASAGGIETLKRLLALLPADFAAPIFVVQHLAPNYPSLLPQILTRAGHMRAYHPRDGEPVRAATVYVAPPDHHLLVEDTHIAVKRGPKENRFRPSVDALFRSTAYSYRNGAIGVVLSGALTDGTSGLWTIKRLGGTSIVQDPSEAFNPSMPLSALRDVDIDYTETVPHIAEILMAKIKQPLPPTEMPPDEELRRVQIERTIAAGAYPLDAGVLELGRPSRYSCPECNGVLGVIQEGDGTRYRCHTGHAYTQDALLAGIQHNSDETIAQTVTALEESGMLLEEMAARSRSNHNATAAEHYLGKARQAKQLVQDLRHILQKGRTALT